MRSELQLMRSSWPQDLLAGVTVAIVALPLALGFGVTSGAGPASGIATAIVAGLLAAILGGSRYQVSGPTGAMTVVLVPFIASFGTEALFALGLLAGLIILVFSLLRLGRFMERIPWSVTEGFTLGIALVIALQQLPLVFQVPRGEGTETLVVAWGAIHNAVTSGVNWISVVVVIATLAIKFGWSAFMHRMKWKFIVPASAVAVIVMTALTSWLNLPIARIGALPASEIFHWGVGWPNVDFGALLYAAVVIAFLGAIESLLSARVADSMAESRDKTAHPAHAPNRELFGQAVGTIASAFVGGMPATGAIARSGVNIHAGAKTRLSAAVHALALVVLVFGLGALVALVPTAVLAGVLLGTSWRIASPRSIAEALRTTTLNKLTFIITAVAVLGIDLIWGTVIGVVFHVVGTAIRKKRASTLGT